MTAFQVHTFGPFELVSSQGLLFYVLKAKYENDEETILKLTAEIEPST